MIQEIAAEQGKIGKLTLAWKSSSKPSRIWMTIPRHRKLASIIDDPRSAYPRLPDILDKETLAAVATLESHERGFAEQVSLAKAKYLRALYLKAFQSLGHTHFQPKDLPQQLRMSIAEQLSNAIAEAEVRTIGRREKSRIVVDVRTFAGWESCNKLRKEDVRQWLTDGVAQQESSLTPLVSAAVGRFLELQVEIPPFSAVHKIAESAFVIADKALENTLSRAFDDTKIQRLIARDVVESKSLLEFFKQPVSKSGPKSLKAELERLEKLGEYQPSRDVIASLGRSKMAAFGELAERYGVAELRQLRQSRQRIALACYAVVRRSRLLDAAAEMFIKVWSDAKQAAIKHADDVFKGRRRIHETHEKILRELLTLVQESRNADELWRAVQGYRQQQEYDKLLEELTAIPVWKDSQFNKLLNHYAAMRRFLPKWYEVMPLVSTTTCDELLSARTLLQKAPPDQAELVVPDAPIGFLSPDWQRRAVRRLPKTKGVARITKAPYELGCLDATVDALKRGALGLQGAHRFAPMTEHLIDRSAFLSDYDRYIEELELPREAKTHYGPLVAELDNRLKAFDDNYEKTKKKVWVRKDGTMGFSRTPSKSKKRRAAKLSRLLAQYMPKVSVLDVLLDCHRWTGFVDALRPISGRQNMGDDEKIIHALAAFHAYGCNCGPTRSGRALGLSDNQVIAMRRHYMPTKALMQAAMRLQQGYERTDVAKRLRHPGVLITDSMHLRVVPKSATARPHHRDRSHGNVLLYQHVTADCICRFAQSAICNASEALHMIQGVLESRIGNEPVINICDTGGKSDLAFGFSSLLNITLYPRVRSGNLKLWVPNKDTKYEHLAPAIAGQIDLGAIDRGWPDMMWVLASIAEGVAPPEVILQRLASQPKHPATRGFIELGKLERSNYLVRYGLDMELRQFISPYANRREHWNKFTREVMAFGDRIREKEKEGQEEVFWFLSVVQNAIVLWNALALDKAIEAAKADGHTINEEDLLEVLPTMIDHIDFMGRFDVDLARIPPFELAFGR